MTKYKAYAKIVFVFEVRNKITSALRALLQAKKTIAAVIVAVILALVATVYSGAQTANADTHALVNNNTVTVSPEVQKTRNLVKDNATINIIHIPVKGDSSLVSRQLSNKSSAITNEVKNMAYSSTSGIFSPSAVTIVNTKAIELSAGCFEKNDIATMKKLDTLAAASIVEGAVNIIATDAEQCFDLSTLTQRAGYASRTGLPVVSKAGYKIFGRTLMHELGHKLGLGHAGTEFKNDVSNGCKQCALTESDEYSIMSYHNDITTAQKFSAAELVEVGLMSSETVSGGEVVLSDNHEVVSLASSTRDYYVELADNAHGKKVVSVRYMTNGGVMVRVNTLLEQAGDSISVAGKTITAREVGRSGVTIAIS